MNYKRRLVVQLTMNDGTPMNMFVCARELKEGSWQGGVIFYGTSYHPVYGSTAEMAMNTVEERLVLDLSGDHLVIRV